MTPTAKSELRGWAQTVLVMVTTLGAGLLAFGRLDAKADSALSAASRAEVKANGVERDVKDLTGALATQNAELVRIRTVLEERLPRRLIETPTGGGK